MASTTEIGRQAEQQVADLIVRRGGYILHRNWRTRWCEIDIVAAGRHGIRFIEVRYRKSYWHGSGFETIVPNKRHRLVRAAEAWCMIYGQPKAWGIDVASVSGPTSRLQIKYLANAIQIDTI